MQLHPTRDGDFILLHTMMENKHLYDLQQGSKFHTAFVTSFTSWPQQTNIGDNI